MIPIPPGPAPATTPARAPSSRALCAGFARLVSGHGFSRAKKTVLHDLSFRGDKTCPELSKGTSLFKKPCIILSLHADSSHAARSVCIERRHVCTASHVIPDRRRWAHLRRPLRQRHTRG